MEEISKCVYCGKKPTIVRLPGDLFYAQCMCGKFGIYDFLGITHKLCVEAWNKAQHSVGLYQKPKGGKK